MSPRFSVEPEVLGVGGTSGGHRRAHRATFPRTARPPSRRLHRPSKAFTALVPPPCSVVHCARTVPDGVRAYVVASAEKRNLRRQAGRCWRLVVRVGVELGT